MNQKPVEIRSWPCSRRTRPSRCLLSSAALLSARLYRRGNRNCRRTLSEDRWCLLPRLAVWLELEKHRRLSSRCTGRCSLHYLVGKKAVGGTERTGCTVGSVAGTVDGHRKGC